MIECIKSNILNGIISRNEHVRIQTQSHSVYEGIIENTDCMGVLFIPSNKKIDSTYILYTDIKKFMLPEHVEKTKSK